MSMETLNTSVSSLIEEDLFGAEMETEELLLRRLSPYATLRPGDLSLLLGLQRQTCGDRSCRKLASSLFDNAIAERSDSDGESDKEPEPEGRDVVVRGQDIGDLPAEYVVRGLRPNELPVIGKCLLPPFLSFVIHLISINHEHTGAAPANLPSKRNRASETIATDDLCLCR